MTDKTSMDTATTTSSSSNEQRNDKEQWSDNVNIDSPQELAAVFGKVLAKQQHHCDSPCSSSSSSSCCYCSVKMEPLAQAAILSSVYKVTFVTNDSSDDDCCCCCSKTSKQDATTHQRSWIAKFLKSSLPLQEMFDVEKTFYRHYAKDLQEAIPRIHIPHALYCGQRCIVLEYVQQQHNVTTYDLLDQAQLKDLQGNQSHLSLALSSLARLHGYFWNTTSSTRSGGHPLSSNAGIGTAMSGRQKEESFGRLWNNLVSDLAMATNHDNAADTEAAQQDDELVKKRQQRLRALCTDLSKRRLRDLHQRVHDYQPTCIHGDFHVGNLLFHNNVNKGSHDDDDDPNNDNVDNNHDHGKSNHFLLTILDWATCGPGNPLIDVVFFILVSTTLTMAQVMQTWLPLYHDELCKSVVLAASNNDDNSNDDSNNDKECLTWESCVFHFRTCLLNQFVVLVCHDEISKRLLATQLKDNDDDCDAKGKLLQDYTKHFANVNKRCVEALLSDEMNLDDYPMPPLLKPSGDEEENTTACSCGGVAQANDETEGRAVDKNEDGDDNLIRRL